MRLKNLILESTLFSEIYTLIHFFVFQQGTSNSHKHDKYMNSGKVGLRNLGNTVSFSTIYNTATDTRIRCCLHTHDGNY